MIVLLGQLFTLLCGSVLTISLFFLTTLFQNSPQIIRHISNLINTFLRFSFIVYEKIINFLVAYLNTEKPNIFNRTVITLIMSLCLISMLFLIFKPTNLLIPISIAIAHGLYIGIVWDHLADPEGLRLGVNLE
jgi:hypothetical protein